MTPQQLTGTTVQMPERLLNPREVAEWLGVSPAWVLDHASSRRRPYLPSVKLGKCVRFRSEDVEKFIRECARMKGVTA
jgi:excisionase family DNA binding protein